MKKHLRAQGFTLIEVLIVIGIIAILAAIVIIAINPAKQFAQARNTQRESAIASILNAIGQNMADNRGTFTCAGAHPLPVNTASSSILIDTGIGIDLSCLAPTYLPSFPLDPTAALGADTGYTISVDSVGRVLVCAPAAAEPTIPDSAALCVKR